MSETIFSYIPIWTKKRVPNNSPLGGTLYFTTEEIELERNPGLKELKIRELKGEIKRLPNQLYQGKLMLEWLETPQSL